MMYDFDNVLQDAICTKNQEQFVSVYQVKGFLEVEGNGSLFLVVSHFLDNTSKSKNL